MWTERITAFFLNYIEAKSLYYKSDGTLDDQSVKDSARLLLDEGIFLNQDDMRKEAMRSFGIILPDWAFERIEKP